MRLSFLRSMIQFIPMLTPRIASPTPAFTRVAVVVVLGGASLPPRVGVVDPVPPVVGAPGSEPVRGCSNRARTFGYLPGPMSGSASIVVSPTVTSVKPSLTATFPVGVCRAAPVRPPLGFALRFFSNSLRLTDFSVSDMYDHSASKAVTSMPFSRNRSIAALNSVPRRSRVERSLPSPATVLALPVITPSSVTLNSTQYTSSTLGARPLFGSPASVLTVSTLRIVRVEAWKVSSMSRLRGSSAGVRCRRYRARA